MVHKAYTLLVENIVWRRIGKTIEFHIISFE